ncbi:keratin-associated protein 10-6-like [Haliotis rubra]|uniref:keratin-associated protein 10-6-like n=1 Tax=Haliotis rubra TaxID=36100 RepID=UPI001EE5FC9B|nr:keratin-associated protein 10-6-like [Haliotis rubra]
MELYLILTTVALAAIQGVSGDCQTDAYCSSGQCCFRTWRFSAGICLIRELFTQYCNSPSKPCTRQAVCGFHECCKETSPGSATGVCTPHGLEKSSCNLTPNTNTPVDAMCACEVGFTCTPNPDAPDSHQGTCASPLTRRCQAHSDCPEKKCCTRFGGHAVCTTPSGHNGKCPT